jgi:hypothetical protein
VTARSFDLGEIRRHGPRPCAHCGSLNDATAAMRENGKNMRPRPGNFSICVKCGELSVYDDNLDLRKPTDDEYIEVAHDPGITVARRSWMNMERSGIIEALTKPRQTGADCVLSMKHVKPR